MRLAHDAVVVPIKRREGCVLMGVLMAVLTGVLEAREGNLCGTTAGAGVRVRVVVTAHLLDLVALVASGPAAAFSSDAATAASGVSQSVSNFCDFCDSPGFIPLLVHLHAHLAPQLHLAGVGRSWLVLVARRGGDAEFQQLRAQLTV